MWKGQKSRRTGHEKFVNVGSGSDTFAGCTFTIGELTPLDEIHMSEEHHEYKIIKAPGPQLR